MNTEQATALRAPFPPSVIGKLPKGGAQLDYVGHAAVTDRLLGVDPEWNWQPLASTPDGLPLLDNDGNLWIQLTVCGTTRLGVGDGRTMKEKIGDAIRNAAMRFGVALDLWSKDELESVATGQRATSNDVISDNEQQHIATCTSIDELRTMYMNARSQKLRDLITTRVATLRDTNTPEEK